MDFSDLRAGAGTAGNGNGGAVILTAGAQHGSGMQGSTFQRGKQNLVPQGAPTAKTVTAAITAAELATGIITTTGATGPSAPKCRQADDDSLDHLRTRRAGSDRLDLALWPARLGARHQHGQTAWM